MEEVLSDWVRQVRVKQRWQQVEAVFGGVVWEILVDNGCTGSHQIDQATELVAGRTGRDLSRPADDQGLPVTTLWCNLELCILFDISV